MEATANYLKMLPRERSWLWLITVFGGIGFSVFIVARTIYRLYFHPLRKIPGPKLAAATHSVEFYYDVVLGGKFCWKLAEMHRKYGMWNSFL